jgi:hypothetical protein
MSVVLTTAEFLRLVAVLMALPGAFFFLRAVKRSRTSRTATYYATRREAAKSSNRDLGTFLMIAVLATVLAIISSFIPAELTPSEQLMPITIIMPSPTTIAFASPAVATRVALTPTPAPTVTSTPAPFATAVRVAPTETPVATDSAGHRLVLYAISDAISAGGLPISPTTEFTRAISTIYIFYEYAGPPQGVLINQTWLRDGSRVYYDSSTLSHSGSGYSYLQWSPKNGFIPGLYEVRVMLADVKQFSANFMVR